MTASDLYQAGRLRDALDAQAAAVKIHPTDQAGRFALFELLWLAGDLDRARKQLDILRYDDPRHLAAVAQYRFALAAEATRRAVFAGTAQPHFLTAVTDHVRLRLEALGGLARGESAGARARLDEANAAVPVLTGTLNGTPFEGLYDADERLGTVLEVVATGGAYTWLPLEQVRSITMNPPQAPRDVFLRPATVTLTDGSGGDVLVCGLYEGTHSHPDDEIRLGRGTEWLGGAEVTRGAGGRLLMAGSEVVPLRTVTAVEIHPPA